MANEPRPYRKMYALTEREYIKYKSTIHSEDCKSVDGEIGDDQKLKIYAHELERSRKNDEPTNNTTIPEESNNDEEILSIDLITSILDKFPTKMRSKAQRVLNHLVSRRVKWNNNLNVIESNGEIIKDSNIID